MPFTPVVVPKATDPDLFVDGARAALEASSAVNAITTGVFSEYAPQNATSPYVTIGLPSVTYESAYNDPIFNVLMDIGCYTAGDSTTTVRALALACLSALTDSPWTVAGMTMISAGLEESGTGFRQTSTLVQGGTLERGRQFSIRILASKP